MMQLEQITPKEAKKYKKLGGAFGISLDHCIEEGRLHCPNFDKKAKYYVVKLDASADDENVKFITNNNTMMVVEFYEDGK
jgi:hypothetical protein